VLSVSTIEAFVIPCWLQQMKYPQIAGLGLRKHQHIPILPPLQSTVLGLDNREIADLYKEYETLYRMSPEITDPTGLIEFIHQWVVNQKEFTEFEVRVLPIFSLYFPHVSLCRFFLEERKCT
jgi:hypothetical protein